MTDDTRGDVDLDLDGKLLQVQFRSSGTYRGQVVQEFLAAAETHGVSLTLAKGMKPEGIHLKIGDTYTDKWLLSLYIVVEEVGDADEKHLDFAHSDKFYAWLKREGKKPEAKATLRLIHDECSDSRAEILYPIVKDIEREFRILALKLGIELGDNLPKRKTGEHPICNLETSELFGVVFMQPASKKYYLDQLTLAETDEDRDQARSATIADEIGFREFRGFLEKMHVVRNPVMHGRYISEAKFRSSLATLKKIRRKLDSDKFYSSISSNQEMMKSISEMIANVTGLTSLFKQSIEPTMAAINSMVASTTQVREITSQVASLSKIMYGPGGLVADASKINVSPFIKTAIPTTPKGVQAKMAQHFKKTRSTAELETYYLEHILPHYDIPTSDLRWESHGNVDTDTVSHEFTSDGQRYALLFDDFPSGDNYIAKEYELIETKQGERFLDLSSKNYEQNVTGYFSLYKE